MFTIITALVLASAGLIVYFWQQIVFFLTRTLIPYITKYLGEKWGATLANIVNWIDGKMVATRQFIKNSWNWVRGTVLGIKSEYLQTSGSECQQKTTTYVRKGDEVYCQETTKRIDWDEFPPEIRKKMITQGVNDAEMDDLALINKRYNEQASREGVVLEV